MMVPKDEFITVDGVKITAAEKVFFEDSGITKADVAKYYAKVSKRMMPHVQNRLLSIMRCTKSIGSACFYQRHQDTDAKGVVTIPIKEKSGETDDYFYVENAQGLLAEVQMDTLEFHIWSSRLPHLEKPDMMIFDLDPGEGVEIKQLRQGVRDVKQVLEEHELITFLKTSGGKGYHIVVPLSPPTDWDTLHDYAEEIAIEMESRWPERYTKNVRKVNRKGKIFIDWLRNSRSATTVAPYSIRARVGAGVSMPIFWEELDKVTPNGISISEAIKRVNKKDPWAEFYTIKQTIK